VPGTNNAASRSFEGLRHGSRASSLVIRCAVAWLSAGAAAFAHADDLPLQPDRKISFETDEGSWLSLDVSPDSREIVFELLGDIYKLPAQGGRATPVLTGMAFDAQPVFSPDGKRIAFISDRSGSENVWIAAADGSNARQITMDSDQERFASPAWSADGHYVYASRRTKPFFAEYHLWMYHVDGGSGIQLTGLAQEPGQALGAYASADGRYVYYARSDKGSYPDAVNPFSWRIVRRDSRTGLEETVLNVPGGALRPVISPNGRFLVYATRFKSDSALRVRDLQTGQDRELIYPIDRDMQEALATRDLSPGYDFTPDGAALIVAFGGKIRRVSLQSGVAEIIPFTARVDLDVGPSLRVAQQETSQQDSSEPVRARVLQAPVVSPDGKQIAFTAFGKLYVVAATGGAPKRLTDTPLNISGMTEHQPAWSPDSRWLTYVSWTSAGGHVYKVRASGGKPQLLTDVPAFYRKPVFTPQGDAIIALRSSAHDRMQRYRDLGERPYIQDVIRLPSNGGAAELLAQLPDRKGRTGFYVTDWGAPHFTSDADAVFVYTLDGLMRVPLQKGLPRKIIQVLVPDTVWGWPDTPVDEVRLSPDGAWALVLQESQLHLLAVPPVGREDLVFDLTKPPVAHQRLTEVGADYFSWSKDGRTIHWAIGSTLYSLPLAAVDFSSKEAVPPKLAEASATALNIVVELPRDVPMGVTVLRGATVATMRGDEVIEQADIVIDGNRIAAIGRHGEVSVPAGAEIRDVTGKFITPGFVDTHAHWTAVRRTLIDYDAWPFAANLAYGVTAGLDVQAFTQDMFIYQDLIDAGVLPGPRAYSVGRGVLAHNRFTSQQHVRGVLSRYKTHYRTGNIKAYMSGNRKQRQYVAQIAKELGLMPTTEGGVDTKLDLTHAIDGFAGNEHSLPLVPLYKDIVELYTQTGIGYTPALLVNYGGPSAEEYFYSRQNPLTDPKLNRFTPPQFLADRARRRGAWIHDEEFVFDRLAASAAKIFRAGGRIGVGSHGQLQGLGYHWEMQAMAAGGLTAHETLQIATRTSAEIIGRDAQIGTLEAGKYADLLVFGTNPLQDIRNTSSIECVMKNGRFYDADDLQQGC
jgi:imidazolonepropionase-like amidohydrolase/Tol biopolymer transport system component